MTLYADKAFKESKTVLASRTVSVRLVGTTKSLTMKMVESNGKTSGESLGPSYFFLQILISAKFFIINVNL